MAQPQVGTVLFNGIDVTDQYGVRILSISPFNVMSGARHAFQGMNYIGSTKQPDNIRLAGQIWGADNETIMQNLEKFCGIFGADAMGSHTEIAITIYFHDSDAAQNDSCILKAVYAGDMEYSLQNRAGRASAAYGNISVSFKVTGYISPDGIVSRSAGDDGVSTDYKNFAWEDANCRQGASNVVAAIKRTAGTAAVYPYLYFLAVGNRFVKQATAGTKTGTISTWGMGSHGNPAPFFPYTSPPTLKWWMTNLFPIAQSYPFTFMIKFKAGSGSHSTNILMCDHNVTNKIQVDYSSSSPYRARFAMNSKQIYVTLPAKFSSSDWNTIVVRYKDSASSGMKIWAKVAGQDIVTEQGADDGLPQVGYDSSDYFFIGSHNTGSYGADAYIDQVCIWKYSLSDDEITAILNSNIPIPDNPSRGINRNITFYTDFSDGFYGWSNETLTVATTAGSVIVPALQNNDEVQVFDAHNHKAFRIWAGTVTDAMDALVTGQWPVVGRYNNVTFGLFGRRDLFMYYMPKRRI